LAGDHMKSVGDLRKPLIGIGLLWNEGYTIQLIDDDGTPQDHYRATVRDELIAVDAELEVDIGGKPVPLRAFKVGRYTSATLYLLEPRDESDRWITQRLYAGASEDRLAQEIVLGVGGVRLLQALDIEPDVYHFNEGHAVFAGLELIRRRRESGESLEDATAAVREHIVFTTHTPVPAGNEQHDIGLMQRMGADVGMSAQELEALGGSPFGMTVAGLRLARRANGVAELHSETARSMWKDVQGAAPIVAITNGVHAPTWQDARIRAATVVDKSLEQRREQLWSAHQQMKRELIALITQRTGTELLEDGLLVGFARRAATYKRADLIFGDSERLEEMFADRRLQLVFSGKAHPADAAGKGVVAAIVEASKRWPQNVVFLENYEMLLGAALTRGCDAWLNNPRRPMEASGTSGMKAAMNGVLNVSILDGWWPEGCRHGETGWKIGDADNDRVDLVDSERDALDRRDRDSLYSVLEGEVMATYYDRREKWVDMMLASIAMSSLKFSSDRMVEDYFRLLYSRNR